MAKLGFGFVAMAMTIAFPAAPAFGGPRAARASAVKEGAPSAAAPKPVRSTAAPAEPVRKPSIAPEQRPELYELLKVIENVSVGSGK